MMRPSASASVAVSRWIVWAQAGSSVLQAKDTVVEDTAWPAGYSTWELTGFSEEPRPTPAIYLPKSRYKRLFPKSRCF